jgi:hypothetical protein
MAIKWSCNATSARTQYLDRLCKAEWVDPLDKFVTRIGRQSSDEGVLSALARHTLALQQRAQHRSLRMFSWIKGIFKGLCPRRKLSVPPMPRSQA